jgi:hypothetical protein
MFFQIDLFDANCSMPKFQVQTQTETWIFAIVCLSVSSVNIKNAQFRTSPKIYVRNQTTFVPPIDLYDANCHWPKFQENPRNEHGI